MRARGALAAFDGVEIVDMKPGKRGFSVKYDKKNATPQAMAAALEKVGEAATIQ